MLFERLRLPTARRILFIIDDLTDLEGCLTSFGNDHSLPWLTCKVKDRIWMIIADLTEVLSGVEEQIQEDGQDVFLIVNHLSETELRKLSDLEETYEALSVSMKVTESRKRNILSLVKQRALQK